MDLHALVELFVGPIVVVAAFSIPGLSAVDREFFVMAGFVIFLIWLLSDYGCPDRVTNSG